MSLPTDLDFGHGDGIVRIETVVEHLQLAISQKSHGASRQEVSLAAETAAQHRTHGLACAVLFVLVLALDGAARLVLMLLRSTVLPLGALFY